MARLPAPFFPRPMNENPPPNSPDSPDRRTDEVVLVVGSTGKTGRRVAERLEGRGITVRHGSRSSATPFDWEDPSTWAPAVEGVTKAYITYYPDLAFPGATEHVRE